MPTPSDSNLQEVVGQPHDHRQHFAPPPPRWGALRCRGRLQDTGRRATQLGRQIFFDGEREQQQRPRPQETEDRRGPLERHRATCVVNLFQDDELLYDAGVQRTASSCCRSRPAMPFRPLRRRAASVASWTLHPGSCPPSGRRTRHHGPWARRGGGHDLQHRHMWGSWRFTSSGYEVGERVVTPEADIAPMKARLVALDGEPAESDCARRGMGAGHGGLAGGRFVEDRGEHSGAEKRTIVAGCSAPVRHSGRSCMSGPSISRQARLGARHRR